MVGRLLKYFEASLGASIAGGRAVLAVLRFVLRTLVSARLADLSAEATDSGGMRAIACHGSSGELTDGRTVHVGCNAPCHHLDVVFGEAG